MKIKFLTERKFGEKVRDWLAEDETIEFVEENPDIVIVCYYGKILEKEGARIDKIYFCPHHPDPEKAKVIPPISEAIFLKFRLLRKTYIKIPERSICEKTRLLQAI